MSRKYEYELKLETANDPILKRIVSFVNGQYLWIGNDADCYGWYSGGGRLRKLALSILAVHGNQTEKAMAREHLEVT